jgi:hypothetical protein
MQIRGISGSKGTMIEILEILDVGNKLSVLLRGDNPTLPLVRFYLVFLRRA